MVDRFWAMLLRAAPLLILSWGKVSPIRACAVGIWNILTRPALSVMAKRCQTCRKPVSIRIRIDSPRQVITSSMTASKRWRGNRSAMAPENRARKFRPIRAEAISPTRKGLPVASRTYHARMRASIWLPVWTVHTEDQTRAKFLCPSMATGYVTWRMESLNLIEVGAPKVRIAGCIGDRKPVPSLPFAASSYPCGIRRGSKWLEGGSRRAKNKDRTELKTLVRPSLLDHGQRWANFGSAVTA